jgi:hypothetical protein
MKSNKKLIIWGLVGVAAVAAGVYVYNKAQNTDSSGDALSSGSGSTVGTVAIGGGGLALLALLFL